jgi:hypothetical protein
VRWVPRTIPAVVLVRRLGVTPVPSREWDARQMARSRRASAEDSGWREPLSSCRRPILDTASFSRDAKSR